MPYILAHDLGTTGNKITLFDAETGLAVVSAFEPYATAYPQPCWAEQDPADWRRAIYAGTRRLLEQAATQAGVKPGAIAGVSFSGMMNGALPVDKAGEPLRPAIIWADQRASVEADLLAERVGAAAVYRTTGSRATPSCSAAKILWFQRHQPEIYADARCFLQAKDYAAFLLTGVFATDVSDASNTNLLDLSARVWAVDMIRAVDLDPLKLPRILPSTAVIGHVTGAAAALTGLLAGTPVVIGGGDGACATVGTGAIAPGDAYTYIGSSAWMAVVADRPLFDPQMRTFNLAHLDPALYFPLGAMQAAGGALGLVRTVAAGRGGQASLRRLGRGRVNRPARRGWPALPALPDGRAQPVLEPGARGAFVGLTMAHGRPAMARAVLEGVTLNLRLILDALCSQGLSIPAMRLIGGGARLPLWRQILADVLGLPILLPDLLAEATSLGAAIAGGIGVGLYPDFSVARRFVQTHPAEQPDPERQARYATLRPGFQAAYRALTPLVQAASV